MSVFSIWFYFKFNAFYAAFCSYKCFWNSINNLLISATFPRIDFASSNDWYLFVRSIGSFSWSSSSIPVSTYLLNTNSMNSFCLSLRSAKMVAWDATIYFQLESTKTKMSTNNYYWSNSTQSTIVHNFHIVPSVDLEEVCKHHLRTFLYAPLPFNEQITWQLQHWRLLVCWSFC